MNIKFGKDTLVRGFPVKKGETATFDATFEKDFKNLVDGRNKVLGKDEVPKNALQFKDNTFPTRGKSKAKEPEKKPTPPKEPEKK